MVRTGLSGIVRKNTGVEVRNGRTVTIRKENLSFNGNSNLVCKVEVITNEPMQQKVGVLKPEVRKIEKSYYFFYYR